MDFLWTNFFHSVKIFKIIRENCVYDGFLSQPSTEWTFSSSFTSSIVNIDEFKLVSQCLRRLKTVYENSSLKFIGIHSNAYNANVIRMFVYKCLGPFHVPTSIYLDFGFSISSKS